MICDAEQENRRLDEKPVDHIDAVKKQNHPRAKTRKGGWLKWGDFLLYGLIGGCAAVLLLFAPLQGGKSSVSAVLTRDHQELLRISSDQLAGSGKTELDVGGYHYKLVWEDGRIRFEEAGCPDKICVRTGWISRPNEIAVCVPGYLVLKIESDDSDRTDPNEPDVIAR